MSQADAVQTARPLRPAPELIVDLDTIDFTQMALTRDDLARWNPHRGHMAQLDGVIWHAPSYQQGVAIKHVRNDEFWVDGHFPDRPLMPGVLMVEAGAQLASYLFYVRQDHECIAGFTRIDNTVFRGQVHPGQDLLILAREVKYHPRRFVSDIQGVVDGKLVFESRITGMVL